MTGNPKFIRGIETFNRKELKKVTLSLFDNGVFRITTKYLDRDTLEIKKVNTRITETSMLVLANMYMMEFFDAKSSFGDWVKPRA